MQEKNKTIWVIILATIFGLVSGVVGTIVARVSLLENIYNVPLFREVSYLDADNQKSNLVIRSAKKVVIEEDDRLAEIVGATKGSVVRIYKNKNQKNVKGATDFSLSDYYLPDENIGDGFVVTSDGWIVSNFIPEGLEHASSSKDKGLELFSSFVIVTSDGRVNAVEKILADNNTPYSFWHINRNDLSVRNFTLDKDLKNGQSVAVVDYRGLVTLNHILSKTQISKNTIFSSDAYVKKISLSAEISPEIKKSFLFDLDGGLVGLFDKDGELYAVDNFVPVINNILKGGDIRHAIFGVSYIDLSKLTKTDSDGSSVLDGALLFGDEKNLAVKKGSPADLSGLKEGDIVTAVNNININKDNDLAYVLSGFMYGDKVSVSFLRENKKGVVEVVLKSSLAPEKK